MLVTKQGSNIKIAVSFKDTPFMNADYIRKLYAMATEEEKYTDWYQDAKNFAAYLVEKYNLDIEKVANLIAAISPQTKWEKNKEFAELAVQAYDDVQNGWLTREDLPKVHKYGAMSETGYAVLFGENFELGQKTTSFAKNILGDTNEVTIDSLAMSILLGFYEKAGSYNIYKTAYKYAQKVYLQVARELGIEPSHLQAVTWVVCRRLKKQHKSKVTVLSAAKVVGQHPLDILEYINSVG